VSYQRHLLQLGLADRLLGELLAHLRRVGLYQHALVVVVADHGIGFHPGMDRRAVEPENVQDLAPVPLLVKLPGASRGVVVDRHVETIDVLPTILDLAGLPSPVGIDGRSLFSPSAAQARRVTIFHRVEHDLNTVGGRYSFLPRQLERRRDEALRRKLDLFGSGGGRDPDALYRIGPYAGLIGRPVASVPRVSGRATARFDQAADLLDSDPASAFVPGELTGRVPNGRPGGGRAIAVALNGTIAATGRTFSLQGSRAESFETIVPEESFRPGANEASVFEILRRGGGGVALRPL